jgi:hypothetical protein
MNIAVEIVTVSSTTFLHEYTTGTFTYVMLQYWLKWKKIANVSNSNITQQLMPSLFIIYIYVHVHYIKYKHNISLSLKVTSFTPSRILKIINIFSHKKENTLLFTGYISTFCTCYIQIKYLHIKHIPLTKQVIILFYCSQKNWQLWLQLQ